MIVRSREIIVFHELHGFMGPFSLTYHGFNLTQVVLYVIKFMRISDAKLRE